jgi:ribonuclease-3
MGDTGEPVIIFRTQSDVEASIVRGLLEAHGIRSAASSDVPHSIFPLTVNGLGEVRVSVGADDADEARRIIAWHREDVVRGQVLRVPAGLGALEESIGHRFEDRGLLVRALTHRSRAHEDATGATPDNESLEFRGDSVLGFVIADTLFCEFPQLDEGQKSKIKSAVVSTATLGRIGRALGLGDHLVLGRGEEKTGGRRKHALWADAYEAVVAALYLDGGIEAARRFVERDLGTALSASRGSPEADHKSALQERLQARGEPVPEYVVVEEKGPAHRKRYVVECRVLGRSAGRGEGHSKKEAQQQAAREALSRIVPEAAGDSGE